MERLLDYFKPADYKIQLNINKHTKKVFGKVEITGEPLKDVVKLHAKGLNITEVKLDGKPAEHDYEDDILTLKNAKNIVINYTFSLNENMEGTYLSSYQHDGKEERLVSTQFESHYARECFPCVDEPAAKANFTLKIITPDTDDTVISNMPAKSERVLEYDTVGDASLTLNTKAKKKIVEFERTPKMPTYLLAFCLGKFHKRSKTSKHGVKVTSYCALNQDPKTLDYANNIAVDSLDFYNDKFGIKYPLKKLDQVAIPDFEAGAMENWGLITYRESCLLAAPNEAKATKEYIATVIAHEISHQWFGNLVTMAWWDDLWLNESFANLMEYVCVDAIRPRYHIWENFFNGECRVALMRDALPGIQAVRQDVSDPAEIATLFDGAIVYAKGARLMFMLFRLLGKKNFYAGLSDYFKAHKYSNTTGNDLWAALQPYADFNVKEFMDAWLSQPGYPVVTDGTHQRFLLSGATDDTKWPLPEVRDDMSGHYLINLSSTEFTEKLQAFRKLSLEQKIRLLLDRSLLAKTALVSSATHLDLLPKFREETNFAVWSAAAGLIADLKLFFSPEEPDFKEFQAYVAGLVAPQIKRLGLKPREKEDDGDAKLRQLALGFALYAEDPEITEQLAALYDEDYEKIDPDLRSDVLFAKLRLSPELFDTYLKAYQETADPNIKDDLMGALTDDKHHATRLIRLLDQHEIVRPQDHLYLFISLLRNYKTRKQATAWLYQNWDEVVKMNGEKSVEDYPRLLATSIRTTEEAKEFEEFFTPLAENPILTRAISVAKADIDARLRLLSMDRDDVHAHLKALE